MVFFALLSLVAMSYLSLGAGLGQRAAHVTSVRALPLGRQRRRSGRPTRPVAVRRVRGQPSAARSRADAGARSRPARRFLFPRESLARSVAQDTSPARPSAHRLPGQASSLECRSQLSADDASPVSAEGSTPPRRSAARASFFARFSSRFSRSACSRARLRTDWALRRAISRDRAGTPARPHPARAPLPCSASSPPWPFLSSGAAAAGGSPRPRCAARRRRRSSLRDLSSRRPPRTAPARLLRAT